MTAILVLDTSHMTDDSSISVSDVFASDSTIPGVLNPGSLYSFSKSFDKSPAFHDE